MAWEWSSSTKRYRDVESGRFLSHNRVIQLRDQFIETQKPNVRALASRLANGNLTVEQWQRQFNRLIKSTWGVEYLLGKGGKNAMSQAEWESLGALVKDQLAFAQKFASDIDTQSLSEAQIGARSELYMNAATNAHAHGYVAAFGLQLPAMPGDGGTQCLVSCRCDWQISETQTEWRAYWRLSSAEHCKGCEGRSQQYNPFTQVKPVNDNE